MKNTSNLATRKHTQPLLEERAYPENSGLRDVSFMQKRIKNVNHPLLRQGLS